MRIPTEVESALDALSEKSRLWKLANYEAHKHNPKPEDVAAFEKLDSEYVEARDRARILVNGKGTRVDQNKMAGVHHPRITRAGRN